MMNECTRDYFVCDGKLKNISEFPQYFSNPAQYIYEVFRVQEGIPIFIEDHLERLWNTASISGVTLPFSNLEILDAIHLLIHSNPHGEGNIKIFISLPSHDPVITMLYFTPHQYPSKEQFEKGVAVRLFRAERTHPNAKVMDVSLRGATDLLKASEDVYEVLLVDSQGFITEGSRSNVFFVQDKKLITPPVHTVLEGVTRKQILHICVENNIAVIEKPVHYSQLDTLGAVFISGTSRRVLPVFRVDDRIFDPGSYPVRQLQQFLEKRVIEYLDRKKIKREQATRS